MMTSDYMASIDKAQSEGRHESSIPSRRPTSTRLNLMNTRAPRLSDMLRCSITQAHAMPDATHCRNTISCTSKLKFHQSDPDDCTAATSASTVIQTHLCGSPGRTSPQRAICGPRAHTSSYESPFESMRLGLRALARWIVDARPPWPSYRSNTALSGCLLPTPKATSAACSNPHLAHLIVGFIVRGAVADVSSCCCADAS